MPKKTYADGDVVYAPLINKLNNIQFVETPNDDGQLPLILDDWLSNAASAIKPTLKSIAAEFSILSITGRTVQYQGGKFATSTQVATIANGSIVVPASATSWVWVNDTNPSAPVIEVTTTEPTTGMKLGKFTADATTITANTPLYARARSQSPGASTNSPAFTGTPTAPTPALNDDSLKLATTAWVQALRPKTVVRGVRTTVWTPSGGFLAETYYTIPFDSITGSGLNTGGIFTMPATTPFASKEALIIARVRIAATDLSRPNINAKLSVFSGASEIAVLSECFGRGVLVLGGSDKFLLTAGEQITIRLYINPANGDQNNSLPSNLQISASNTTKFFVEV